MKLANDSKDNKKRQNGSEIYTFQANNVLIDLFSIVLSTLYTSIAMEAPVYIPMSPVPALAIGPW
jgi:hypothetical protein